MSSTYPGRREWGWRTPGVGRRRDLRYCRAFGEVSPALDVGLVTLSDHRPEAF